MESRAAKLCKLAKETPHFAIKHLTTKQYLGLMPCNQLNPDFCFDLSEFCCTNSAHFLKVIDTKKRAIDFSVVNDSLRNNGTNSI